MQKLIYKINSTYLHTKLRSLQYRINMQLKGELEKQNYVLLYF